MSTVRRSVRWFLVGLSTVVLVGCGADATPSDSATPAPGPAQHGPFKPVVSWPVPDFAATDQDGAPVGLAQLKGKVWIAMFFFLDCSGPCPDMLRAMAEVHSKTRDVEGLTLVSFTFRPDTDTEPRLRERARQLRADSTRWKFLRMPSQESLAHLMDQGFKDGSWDHHTARFFLIDQEGAVRRWWDARDRSERTALLNDAHSLLRGEALQP